MIHVERIEFEKKKRKENGRNRQTDNEISPLASC